MDWNWDLWITPLKDQKSFTIANAFQKGMDKSGCKLNNI